MPFFRQTGQHGDGFARWGKDGLFLCPAVPGERDGDGVGLLQDLLQHKPLLGGKVGEAVQINVFLLKERIGAELLGQAGEAVTRVQGPSRRAGLIGPEDEAQVPELLPVQPLCLLPHLGQRLAGDAAAFQLIHGGEETAQKLRAAGRHGVDGQVGRDGAQGGVHGQQPPALVQHRLGHAPGQGEDAVFQTGKGEDLSIHPRPVSVLPAEALLRLKGRLFRHQ